MGNEKDRLSILEKIERGEISFEEAEKVLKQTSEGEGEEVKKAKAEASEELVVEAYIPTRRERKLALAERFQDWQPHMMVQLENKGELWEWPWEEKSWQWMWQNLDYPIYIGHSMEVAEGSELQIVAYQGDLFIRGWEEPELKVNGAIFDIRIGQERRDGNSESSGITRIASSTGQLQIWVPSRITRIGARVMPGDMWISGVSADLDLYCQSGDLGCEQIKGNVSCLVNGGDVRLMGVEGAIDVHTTRGNSEVRDILSHDVNLKATEGNIWLNLNSINKGCFSCENNNGDINLLISGELACELTVEADEGGRISPVSLPWQKLLERAEGRLRGIIKGGGASINLITHGGKIYIQESWVRSLPTVSPS